MVELNLHWKDGKRTVKSGKIRMLDSFGDCKLFFGISFGRRNMFCLLVSNWYNLKIKLSKIFVSGGDLVSWWTSDRYIRQNLTFDGHGMDMV